MSHLLNHASAFQLLSLSLACITFLAHSATGQETELVTAEDVNSEWKMLQDFPSEIDAITVKIEQSHHAVTQSELFIDRNITFASGVHDPATCKFAARRIHGARGPCFGNSRWSGPPDTRFGTLKMSSKLAKDPLIVTITNSGFYLGSELDHRMKFHSWHLAKVVNDLAIENGTCLTQGSFNSLSGVSWIIRDQHREFEFDKRKYRTRPAKIWNFLPDEILARSQEPDVTKTFAKEDEETSDAASDK